MKDKTYIPDYIVKSEPAPFAHVKVKDWVSAKDVSGNIYQDRVTGVGYEFGKHYFTLHKTKTLKYDYPTGLAKDNSGRRAIRILEGGEVIVDFGTFRGWIRRSGKYNIEVFSIGNYWLATASIAMFDAETRELVEDLLKQIEEEE